MSVRPSKRSPEEFQVRLSKYLADLLSDLDPVFPSRKDDLRLFSEKSSTLEVSPSKTIDVYSAEVIIPGRVLVVLPASEYEEENWNACKRRLDIISMMVHQRLMGDPMPRSLVEAKNATDQEE